MSLERIDRKIDGLRNRIRAFFLLIGLTKLLFALASLLLLSFLLDYALHLPVPVRIASAVIALLVVVVVTLRSVAYPLSVRLGDEDLALAVEARRPDLRDRLISALQFRRHLSDADVAESRPMMEAVIAETGELKDAFSAREFTDAKALRLSGLLALAGVALFAIIVLTAPASAGVWARRNLLLADVPWPRLTTLVVTSFGDDDEVVITRGQSIRIDVRAEGRVPDDVRIWYQRMEVDRTDQRRMFQVEDAPDRFQFEFRQVPDSFRFWVTGGDDTDGRPVYTVRALVPPTIEAIEAAVTYPAHTGEAPRTLTEGDLDLPEGSRVAMKMRVNMPLESAEIRRGDAPPEPMALSSDGLSIETELTADRTYDYVILMTGRDGQKNLPDSARFRMRSVPDRKPLARVLFPAAREWFAPEGLVPFKIFASDNYGVSRVALFFRRGNEGEFREYVFSSDALSAPLGAKEIVAYAGLGVAALGEAGAPPRSGDEISFFAEVTDNNGNVDRTDRYKIEIVTAEELERKLSQQQAGLREKVLEYKRRQEQALKDTSAILDFLETEGRGLETRDRERLRDIQVLQGRITRDMDRFATQVGRVFNAYAYNRLASPVATERILAIFDEFLRSDHENLSVVFKRELYEQVIAAYEDGRIFDQEILQVLIEILGISFRVNGESSPRAQALLAGLARGEPEKDLLEDLRTVADIQKDILADFRQLDQKMQRWEAYTELIDELRRIKEIEKGIQEGAEELR